jgi:hypothetical protein
MEDGVGKQTALWRLFDLGSVAIRGERVQAVPGVHVLSPDSVVHLLLPVPVVLQVIQQRHSVSSQSEHSEQ